MILADKIIDLRKKRGWSQEQLAERLGVSRQSVSKWEGGLSVPDLDKILKISSIFAVSTDYLLKDEIDSISAEHITEEENSVRTVSVEEANRFMNITESKSSVMALAVTLFIASPVPLIFLGGLTSNVSGSGKLYITENAAAGIGVAILLIMVTIGVVLLILNGMQMSKYSYLENQDIYPEYGVKGIAEKKMADYEKTHRTFMACGVGLCIMSAVPLMVSIAFTVSDFMGACMVCVILALVATGVFLLIKTNTINESYQKLLQTGDYTPKKKYLKRKLRFLPDIYWCAVTAVYLFISFTRNSWTTSWVIWPVAGVAYGAIWAAAEMFVNDRQ